MTLVLGGGSPAERVSGLALGTDDYLSKLFYLPELVLRARALDRRRPRAVPVVLRAGGGVSTDRLDGARAQPREKQGPNDQSRRGLGASGAHPKTRAPRVAA